MWRRSCVQQSENVTVFDLQRRAARYLSLDVRRLDNVQTRVFQSRRRDFKRAQAKVVLHRYVSLTHILVYFLYMHC